MHQALLLKNPKDVDIPSERTVYRIMDELGISHRPKRKPNGITKANRRARKSDDLLKRNFKSGVPLTKTVTDITEIKASDGKLYVSVIFDDASHSCTRSFHCTSDHPHGLCRPDAITAHF